MKTRVEAKVLPAEPGEVFRTVRDGKTYAFPVMNWVDYSDQRRMPLWPFKLGTRGVLEREDGTYVDEQTGQAFASIDEVRKHYYDPDHDRPEQWGDSREA